MEAARKIEALVHKTSPGVSAEPDLSRTPLKKCFEEGGRDKEGGALKSGEPTLPARVGDPHWGVPPVPYRGGPLGVPPLPYRGGP